MVSGVDSNFVCIVNTLEYLSASTKTQSSVGTFISDVSRTFYTLNNLRSTF